MKKNRFASVLKINAAREKYAAINYAKKKVACRAVEEKIEMLRQYRTEYLRKITLVSSSSIPASYLHDTQAFIIQLDSGLSLLREQLKQQQRLSEQEYQVWLKNKQGFKSVNKLIENITKKQQQVLDQRIENELEDLYLSRRA